MQCFSVKDHNRCFTPHLILRSRSSFLHHSLYPPCLIPVGQQHDNTWTKVGSLRTEGAGCQPDLSAAAQTIFVLGFFFWSTAPWWIKIDSTSLIQLPCGDRDIKEELRMKTVYWSPSPISSNRYLLITEQIGGLVNYFNEHPFYFSVRVIGREAVFLPLYLVPLCVCDSLS